MLDILQAHMRRQPTEATTLAQRKKFVRTVALGDGTVEDLENSSREHVWYTRKKTKKKINVMITDQ